MPSPRAFLTALLADLHRIGRARLGIDRNAKLLAEHVQLLDGGRTLQVGGDEHRLAAALLDQPAELAAGGRFAGALQAAQHQHRHVGLQMQRMIDRAHQVDELAMDDAEHLLVGIDRFQHPFADGLLGDLGDELLDDRIADVGFEQSPFDELHARRACSLRRAFPCRAAF